jgi:hypothetical protein
MFPKRFVTKFIYKKKFKETVHKKVCDIKTWDDSFDLNYGSLTGFQRGGTSMLNRFLLFSKFCELLTLQQTATFQKTLCCNYSSKMGSIETVIAT